MWQNIIKAAPHKTMARKIINDYLESIELYNDEFLIKDIRDWAYEQNELYKNSNGSEGANYESLKYTESGPDAVAENIGVPTSNSISQVLKKYFFGNMHDYKVDFADHTRDNRRPSRDHRYRRVK